MKILFFSATGNSLWVAKKLSGEILSIPKLERDMNYEIESDVIGIVCPIYGLGIPKLVAKYLCKVKIKADYIFAVLTYGKWAGDAAYTMQQLLARNGNNLDYAATLLMLDNFLPVFTMEEELAKLPEKDVAVHFAQIKQDITAHKIGIQRGKVDLPKDISQIMSTMKNQSVLESASNKNVSIIAADRYSVKDVCTGCGICEKLCPVGNIIVKDHPEWGSICEGCLSCVHNCPQSAIWVKGERGKARYRHSEITVAELIKANSTE